MASGPEEPETIPIQERLQFWKKHEKDKDMTSSTENTKKTSKKSVVDLARNFDSDVILPSSKIKTTGKPGTAAAQSPVVSGSSKQTRIVLFGKTGVGKSATCNMILGEKRCKEGISQSSVTRECQDCTGKLPNGREVTVVDTPGLFDTGRTQDETTKSITECVQLCSHGPQAFLMILSCNTRYTDEEHETLMEIQKIFGKDIYQHTIVLFTHRNALDELTPEEYYKTFPGSLQDIIKSCGGRTIFVENRDPNAHSKYYTELFHMIDELVKKKGHYTDDVFSADTKGSKQEKIKQKVKIKREEKAKELEYWKRKAVELKNAFDKINEEKQKIIDEAEEQKIIDKAEIRKRVDEADKQKRIDEAEKQERIVEIEEQKVVDEAEIRKRVDEAEKQERIVEIEEQKRIDEAEKQKTIDKEEKQLSRKAEKEKEIAEAIKEMASINERINTLEKSKACLIL